MESSAPSYVSIRVGAIVPKGGMICGGCPLNVQHPHGIPGNRFTVLVYMPVMEQAPPDLPYLAQAMPFLGGPRTPPVEIDGVQMVGHKTAVSQFMRFLHWN